MKKILSVITVLFIILQTAFTQAPELKNMMPNSWHKLTRLSNQEEKDFFIQQKIMYDIENVKSESWTVQKYHIEEKRVYKEIVNNIEFYRVLTCNQKMSDFLEEDYNDKIVSEDYYNKFRTYRIQQTIYIKHKSNDLIKLKVLEYRVYGVADGNMETESCEYFIFNDVLIKPLNKNEIGFFIIEVGIGYQRKNIEHKCEMNYTKLKNQKCASNFCEFLRVKNREDFSKAFSDSDRRIRIQASDCLFDSKCPFKYSIQNAFDGNPATSYVENTEDDLMNISFSGFKSMFSKKVNLAIINGYALNEKYYYANNRIIELNANSYKINDERTELIPRAPIQLELEDKSLTYQVVAFDYNNRIGTFSFSVARIAKGNSFDDTCIAELNLSETDNFVFGEIYE